MIARQETAKLCLIHFKLGPGGGTLFRNFPYEEEFANCSLVSILMTKPFRYLIKFYIMDI